MTATLHFLPGATHHTRGFLPAPPVAFDRPRPAYFHLMGSVYDREGKLHRPAEVTHRKWQLFDLAHIAAAAHNRVAFDAYVERLTLLIWADRDVRKWRARQRGQA